MAFLARQLERGVGGDAEEALALLYESLAGEDWVLAHLGQSLDGYIASADGQMNSINGSENIDHIHRLRALADCVVIGAGTLVADNPQLTVRRCPGDNPLRVVLDSRGAIGDHYRLFHDGAAPSVVYSTGQASGRCGQAEVVSLPLIGDTLDLRMVLSDLRARGCRRIYIEGGGLTVSRFLSLGLLDRLQITIAPLILGQGRRGLHLPEFAKGGEALRPVCQTYSLGQDVLFDCDLRC